jgi:hypothetical protein
MIDSIYFKSLPFLLLLISFFVARYSASFFIGANKDAMAACSVLDVDSLHKTLISFRES